MTRKNKHTNNLIGLAIVALIIAIVVYGYAQYSTTAAATPASAQPISQATPTAMEQELQTQEISIDASSTGFYLGSEKITALTVKPHALVTLSIRVPQDVGYYGLIFKSPRFPNLKVNAGQAGVVEFGSEGDFEITSYKPATATSPAESELAVLRVVAQ